MNGVQKARVVEEEIMDSALKKHDSSQCPYCEVIFS
jgi:hypothetical protein